MRHVSDPKTASRQGRQVREEVLGDHKLLGALCDLCERMSWKTARKRRFEGILASGSVVGRPGTGGGPLRLVFWGRKLPFQPENRKIRPQINANGSRRSPANANRLLPTSPLHRRLARRFMFCQYFAASRKTMCIRSARFVSKSRNYRL